MNTDLNNLFDNLYDELINEINTMPLTSNRLNDYSDIISINENIVNTIFNIRRSLEINDTGPRENTRDNTQRQYTIHQNNNSNEIRSTNNLQSNILNTLVDIFLETSFINENLFNIDNLLDIQNLEDVKITLPESDFNKLKKINITNENCKEYNKPCNICMDEYKLEDIVVELSCKHLFHETCIKHWLCKEKVTCPVCRKDCRN